MSLTAAALRLMADKGLSAHDIAEIAEALAAAPSSGAERQRRYRERKVEQRNACDVTRDVTDGDASPSPLNPPLKVSPDPFKITPPISPQPASVTARERYHRLPADWTPTKPLPPKTQAKADQWPPGALDDELAALHRWAANAKNENGKGRKLDWDRAWVTWIERRDDEQYGKTNRGGNGRMGGPRPDPTLALVRAAVAAQRPDDRDHRDAGPSLSPRQLGGP